MCETLKPCPFHGTDASMHDIEDRWGRVYQRVECDNGCCVDGMTDQGWGSGKDAAKAWNHRPTEDRLRAKLREIEVLVDRLSMCSAAYCRDKAIRLTNQIREIIDDA